MPGIRNNSHSNNSTKVEPDFRNCGTPTLPQLGQYLRVSGGIGSGAGDLTADKIPSIAITTATRAITTGMWNLT